MSEVARPIQSTQHDEDVRKAGLVMIGVFAVLSVLTVCGGGVAQLLVAANMSESQAVQASYLLLSPMGGALFGLVASVIGHVAIKKSKAFKILLPLVIGFFGMPCVLGCMVVFYEAIWPSL